MTDLEFFFVLIIRYFPSSFGIENYFQTHKDLLRYSRIPHIIAVVIVTVEPTFFKALFSVSYPGRKEFRGRVNPLVVGMRLPFSKLLMDVTMDTTLSSTWPVSCLKSAVRGSKGQPWEPQQ